MNDFRLEFAIQLSAIMHVCAETSETLSGLHAFADKTLPNIYKSEQSFPEVLGLNKYTLIITSIIDSMILKTTINTSIMIYKYKESVNIFDVITLAQNYANIFTVSKDEINNKSNIFINNLNLIKPDIELIVSLRNNLLAHVGKNIIKRTSSIQTAFESYDIEWNSFIKNIDNILDKIIEILEYYNSVSYDGYKMLFSAKSGKEHYAQMHQLLSQIV